MSERRAELEALMAVVRCALHGGVPSEVSHFERLLSAAQRQTVDSLLWGLPSLPVPEGERDGLLQWLPGVAACEAQALRMNRWVATLGRLLDEGGVRYAVMKGQTCAHYYPQPLLRCTGDIDVYVPAAHYERARQLLAASGLQLKERTMLHDTYTRGALIVELHFAISRLQWPASDRRLRAMTARDFDEAPPAADHFLPIGGRDIRTLPPELNMVLLTAHALQHVICGGLGLRQIIDWQLVLTATAGDIDFPRLLRMLDETGLRPMFEVLGRVNVSHLGMDGSLLAAQGIRLDSRQTVRLAERLLNWTALCGNFGHDMDLGHGFLRLARYYGWFFINLLRFFQLCPREMMAWPWMKLLRGLTGRSHQKPPKTRAESRTTTKATA